MDEGHRFFETISKMLKMRDREPDKPKAKLEDHHAN
jgi:hypothetical protein